MANVETYIPMGNPRQYNMTHTQIGGPIVSVYKYFYFGSTPPLDPKWIMHVRRHVCERKVRRVCPQGNIV